MRRALRRFAITCAGTFFTISIADAGETLATAVIRESSVYSSSDFFELYKTHLGRPVTDGTSAAIAEAVRDRYRQDGYSRPGFRVLDHGVHSGIVRIRLVEASISGVTMNGDAGPYRRQVDALFADLPSSRSLKPAEIRDMLRRANRMPGLDVNVRTSPDDGRNGGFLLEVDSDYRTFEGVTTLSNRGTREIGRNILFARLTRNGLFGGSNAAGLFAATAEDSSNYKSGGAYVNATHGESGLTATLQASAASLKIESSGIPVDQNRERVRMSVKYPLDLDAAVRATVWGAFELDDLDMRQAGVPSREERLRGLEAGVSVSWRRDALQQLVKLSIEKGLNAFDGRLDNHLNPGDARVHDYTILEAHYVNLTRLGERWSLRFDALAQYSGELLPSTKQFKVGGGRIGRGFEAAALRGERGAGGKLELSRKLEGNAWILERAEAYGFLDQGSAWRGDVAGRESAASAGVGYRMRAEHFSGGLELAKPLTHDDADGRRDASLFFEVSARF